MAAAAASQSSLAIRCATASGPASRRLEGVCQTRRHGTALGRRQLLLEATAQKLTEQRMEAAGTGIARSCQKEPAPLAKGAARTDAGGVGHVEVRRRGRGEQLLAPLGIEAIQQLLLEVVVQHAAGGGPRLPGPRPVTAITTPSGQPSVSLDQDVDLVGQRLAIVDEAHV